MDGNDMMLLVDAGNTRVKFGWLDGRDGAREPETLALAHGELSRLPAWLETLPARPQAALGANVAGAEMEARLDEMIRQRCGHGVQWQQSAACAAGVLNTYEEPQKLGTDRWISLLGLAAHSGGAAILATFGTATTIDTLTAPCATSPTLRRFIGGVILPGPDLMRRSLAAGTAGLPYAEGEPVPFPRNTHAAIASGIMGAQAGAVVRQRRHALDELGVAPQVYCSGGGWPWVAEEVTAALARCQTDAGLAVAAPRWLGSPVLDGLAALARTA